MRRVTLHKPLKRTDSRRLREETEERPEVRKDIARIWWPDG
ncbi:hypothetical protein ACFVHS_23105 [Streptomyces sp. NPDC057746]